MAETKNGFTKATCRTVAEVEAERDAHAQETHRLLMAGNSPQDLARLGYGKKARRLKDELIAANYYGKR